MNRFSPFLATLSTFFAVPLIVLVCVAPLRAASAADPVIVVAAATEIALGQHIDILEDSSATLGIDDVSAPPHSSDFYRHPRNSINQGVTRSVFWFRFTLAPTSEGPIAGSEESPTVVRQWLLYLGKQLDYFDSIQVFTKVNRAEKEILNSWEKREFGLFHAQRAGTRDPLYITLDIPQRQGCSLAVYLRIEVESGFFLTPTLFSHQQFTSFSNRLSSFYGMYYGVVLSMIVYNLFHYFFLREKVRLIFISYAAVLALYFFIANELSQTIIPASYLLSTRKFAQFLSLITIIQTAWFTSAFLDTRKTLPLLHLLLIALMGVSAMFIVALPFFPYFTFGKILLDFGTIAVVVGMLTGIVSWYRGFQPARFFVFAWAFFLGGGLIYVFNFKGVFPYPFIGNNAFQAGSAIEMVLLSLAIADRVKYLFDQLQSSQIRRQKQLKALTQQLVRTEERERRRIAAVLHDSIGQTLFAIKWEVQRLLDKCDPDSRSDQRVLSYLDSCIDETRTLNAELYPPELYDLGLSSALSTMAGHFGQKFGLHVEVISSGAPDSDDEELKIVLFRSVSELLNNVAKHAKARQVTIHIGRDNGTIRISVADDGIGFASANQKEFEFSGFGLFFIQERLRGIGGSFEILERSGGGTEVILSAPARD
jgi:signal transduction histidine kinase